MLLRPLPYTLNRVPPHLQHIAMLWCQLSNCSKTSLLLTIAILFLAAPNTVPNNTSTTVKVFHYTIGYWALSVEGEQPCSSDLVCEWAHADTMHILKQKYRNSTANLDGNIINVEDRRVIDVSVYNIHSWWERAKEHGPAICDLPTTLTLAESEESKVRYHGLFDPTFKFYDGYSTTHPSSSIQRVYESAFLNNSQFINEGKMHPFSNLIKAASYVAGDCHKRDNANANRDNIVFQIRRAGFRVEGLGRCMHSINPEGKRTEKKWKWKRKDF